MYNNKFIDLFLNISIKYWLNYKMIKFKIKYLSKTFLFLLLFYRYYIIILIKSINMVHFELNFLIIYPSIKNEDLS